MNTKIKEWCIKHGITVRDGERNNVYCYIARICNDDGLRTACGGTEKEALISIAKLASIPTWDEEPDQLDVLKARITELTDLTQALSADLSNYWNEVERLRMENTLLKRGIVEDMRIDPDLHTTYTRKEIMALASKWIKDSNCDKDKAMEILHIFNMFLKHAFPTKHT